MPAESVLAEPALPGRLPAEAWPDPASGSAVTAPLGPPALDPALSRLAQREIIAAGVARCAVVGCAWRDAGRWQHAFGVAGDVHDGRAAELTTPFDLASLTKPFLASALARCSAAGRLSLQARLAELLPSCAHTTSAELTLELLLAHRGGLDAHLRLFAAWQHGSPVRRARWLERAANARRASCQGPVPIDGFPALYSDLGYLLAGTAAERALNASLDEIVRAWVCEPLKLNVASARQWLARAASFREHVAPTEIAAHTCRALRGRVHDENAWALGGLGACGHAGLFGDVGSVVAFGAHCIDAVLGRSAWLSADSAARLVTRRAGSSYAAGFDTKAPSGSSAGQRAHPSTFGHLGFTGTSLWCDPAAQRVMVLLCNRVCPSRGNDRIRQARPRVHDALHAYAPQPAV